MESCVHSLTIMLSIGDTYEQKDFRRKCCAYAQRDISSLQSTTAYVKIHNVVSYQVPKVLAMEY